MKDEMKKDDTQARDVEKEKVKSAGVIVRSGTKAGGPVLNHNQTKGVRVRSGVKAGGWNLNHNQAKGVRVRSGVKAGSAKLNHNQAIARG